MWVGVPRPALARVPVHPCLARPIGAWALGLPPVLYGHSRPSRAFPVWGAVLHTPVATNATAAQHPGKALAGAARRRATSLPPLYGSRPPWFCRTMPIITITRATTYTLQLLLK